MLQNTFTGKNKLVYCAIVFFAFIISVSGCSGGEGYKSVSENRGSLNLNVNWPSGNGRGKYIPENADKIAAVVYKDDLETEVGYAEIPYGQDSVTIEDIPAGSKVIRVRALDESGNILSQRSESVIIQNGKTVDSGELPLGVALVETDTGVEFEPSVLDVAEGDPVYFQNWTDKQVVIRARRIVNDDLVTEKTVGKRKYQNRWTFPDKVLNANYNLKNRLVVEGEPQESECLVNVGWEITGFAEPSSSFDNKTLLNSSWGPLDVVAADFNQDGYMDMANTVYAENSSGGYGHWIAVHMNDGTGTFTKSTYTTTHYRPFSITSGDFNADGYPDLAVGMINSNTSGGRSRLVNVFINTGASGLTGNFDSTNGSGKFYYNGYDYILRAVEAADFNQDGYDDLAVTYGRTGSTSDSFTRWFSVFMNKGEENPAGGPFDTAAGYRFDYLKYHYGNYDAIKSGDFNGDGYPDLVIGAVRSSSTGSRSNQLSVFINKWNKRTEAEHSSDGPFDDTVNDGSNNGGHFTVGSGDYEHRGVVCADFNLDGYDDIAVGNSFASSSLSNSNVTNRISVFLNQFGGMDNPDDNTAPFISTSGVGRFDIHTSHYRSFNLDAGDLNNDGYPDLAAPTYHSSSSAKGGTGARLNVFINQKNESSSPFDESSGRIVMTARKGGFGVTAGDFNVDGRPDISLLNYYNGSSRQRTLQVFLQEP